MTKLLPTIVNYMVGTRTGADKIDKFFSPVLASCPFRSENDPDSNKYFKMPDFLAKTAEYQNRSNNIRYYYATIGKTNNPSVRQEWLDASVGTTNNV